MKPLSLMAAVLAAALIPAAPSAEASPHPVPQEPFKLILDYDGSLLIKVLDVRIEQALSPEAFTADAQIRTSGILSLFKKVDLRATSQGAMRDDTPAPGSFRHENRDGSENRKVQVRWEPQDVSIAAAPLWPTMGDPQPTSAQKRAAADPLTQLMRLSLAASPEGPCHGPMRMFDGRQLYEVTFVRPTPRPKSTVEQRYNLANPIGCTLSLKEVAGFDPKPANNRSQGLKMPLALDLAQLAPGGPWIITSVVGKTPLGDARIELRAVKLES